MKKLVIFLIVLTGVALTEVAWSQGMDRFPVLRERIAQAKLREINKSLNLDQSTFEAFRPVYLAYEKEVTSVDFRKLARLIRIDADSLNAQEADQMIRNQLETARKLVDIREKYYHEFRKMLTPQQIIRLYQTEAEIRRKVMQELRSRMLR